MLHLFAMYMDTQLPPDPTKPDGRAFSSTHLVKTPEKPLKPTPHPMLYLTQVIFLFIVPLEQKYKDDINLSI